AKRSRFASTKAIPTTTSGNSPPRNSRRRPAPALQAVFLAPADPVAAAVRANKGPAAFPEPAVPADAASGPAAAESPSDPTARRSARTDNRSSTHGPGSQSRSRQARAAVRRPAGEVVGIK